MSASPVPVFIGQIKDFVLGIKCERLLFLIPGSLYGYLVKIPIGYPYSNNRFAGLFFKEKFFR